MKELGATKDSLFDSSPCRLAAFFSYQCMKRRDGENPQAPQGCFGWPAGDGQQALWVGQLAALQAGKVAAHPEQIHVEPLQVLLPLLDLKNKERKKKNKLIDRIRGLISNDSVCGDWLRGNECKRSMEKYDTDRIEKFLEKSQKFKI